MKQFRVLTCAGLLCLIQLPVHAQLGKTLNKAVSKVTSSTGSLSTEQVADGLKEALTKGANTSTESASKTDGFYKNPEIKIPFPEDTKEVETKLRSIGMNKQVDEFIETMNHAAENAASEAKSILVDAIKAMTVQDAWNILKGEDDAATVYLRTNTESQIKEKFKPIIQKALDATNATKYYTDLITTYNKIPMVKKVNPDLTDYATDKALDGLFTLVADEEKAIREDPVNRTTDLLKKVFAQQD